MRAPPRANPRTTSPSASFRTWVKNVEVGTFPDVKRHFAVLRCNHCADAPCVEVCPVTAMYQRPDGLVDFDHDMCIGCKACMQACPYDAIYMDPDSNTAAKCNFCSHRVDEGLLPSCVVVCPEEALLFGDMEDPTSKVQRALVEHDVTVRRPEQGTRPQAFYIGAHDATLDPLAARHDATYMWADRDARDHSHAPLPVCSANHARTAGARRLRRAAPTHVGLAGVVVHLDEGHRRGIGSASAGHRGTTSTSALACAPCSSSCRSSRSRFSAPRARCWSAISNDQSASGRSSRGRSGGAGSRAARTSSRRMVRCSARGRCSRCSTRRGARAARASAHRSRRADGRLYRAAAPPVRGARSVAEPIVACRIFSCTRSSAGARPSAIVAAALAGPSVGAFIELFVVALLVTGALALADALRRHRDGERAPRPRTRSRAARRRGCSGRRLCSASSFRCCSR